jgi:hypothetical protein
VDVADADPVLLGDGVIDGVCVIVGSGVPPRVPVEEGLPVLDALWLGVILAEDDAVAVLVDDKDIDTDDVAVFDGVGVAVAVTVGMQYVSVNAGDKPRITVFVPAVTTNVGPPTTVLYI